jgi:hypothetical protein
MAQKGNCNEFAIIGRHREQAAQAGVAGGDQIGNAERSGGAAEGQRILAR